MLYPSRTHLMKLDNKLDTLDIMLDIILDIGYFLLSRHSSAFVFVY